MEIRQKQDKLLVEVKLLVVCAEFYTEQSRLCYGDFFKFFFTCGEKCEVEISSGQIQRTVTTF